MAAPMDPDTKKKLFLAVVLVLGLGYLGYDYVYRPRQEEIVALEERLESLRLQNRVARELTAQQGRTAVERRLQLYREQLARVEGLIPTSEEVPDLLDAISAQAQRAGVELSLIQPVGAVNERYYTRRTYDLAVRGRYHDIGAFLTEIASLPRVITPLNLNVAIRAETDAGESPELEAKFTIETYVLPTTMLPPDSAHAP